MCDRANSAIRRQYRKNRPVAKARRDTLEWNENVNIVEGVEQRVNTFTTGNQESQQITALSGGGWVVTWQSTFQDGDGYGVYQQAYAADGSAIGVETRVNTSVTGNQWEPQIAALSGGGWVVTWRGSDQVSNISSGVYQQTYAANGNAVGGETLVNTYVTNEQYSQQITALTGGGWVVTWNSGAQDGSGFGVYQQAYAANGSVVGAETRVNIYITGEQVFPRIAALSNGGWVVTWISHSQDGDSWGVYQQAYAANGGVIGSETRVNTYVTGAQESPRIIALSTGGWVVAWQSTGQDGSNSGVYQQVYAANGSPVGSEMRVNTYTTDHQNSPQFTALSDGGWVVTWMSNGQDGSDYGIYQQTYAANGSAIGTETRVNSWVTDYQGGPHVKALSGGGWVVVWTSKEQDGSGYGTYQQAYTADGNPIDLEHRVNSYTENQQQWRQVTALTDGRWVVTWLSTDQDGSGSGVYQKIFSLNEAPSGPTTGAPWSTTEDTFFGFFANILLAGFTDADGDTLTVTDVTVSTGASMYHDEEQDLYMIRPDQNFHGTLTLSYTVSDGRGGTTAVTRTVTYTPVNDAPTGTVTISGTAAQNAVLTASNMLADADGLGTVSYQWLRDGVDIQDATGSEYTLAQADVGANISVKASYTDDDGTAESKTSDATETVANVNDAPTGTLILTGTAIEDEVLIASNTFADADGLGTVSYQWLRDGVAIHNATGSTYTLTQADVGAQIGFFASYTDGQGNFESMYSGATTSVYNVDDPITGSVVIAGTASQGKTLTASHTLADEDGLREISYTWLRDGVPIQNATATTYKLTQADVGAKISFAVYHTDNYGSLEVVTSATTATIANVNDIPTGTVKIAGTASQGKTLTASHTLADIDGLGAISYQWLRNGVAINNATDATYTLTQADVGAKISIKTSYTDGQGTLETKTSATTATIANVNDAPVGTAPQALPDGIEDTPYTVSEAVLLAGFSDADGDTLHITAITADAAKVVNNHDGTYTINPGPNFYGPAGVQYTVSDGKGGSISVETSVLFESRLDRGTGAVTITGTIAEDAVLTASNALVDGDGIILLSYQWMRNGVAIKNAIGETYTLKQADVGAKISVVATYMDFDGNWESHTSAQTTPVANVNDASTGAVKISGTATQGKTLTASHTLSDADGLGTVSYQWQRDGVAIKNATAATYKLTQADVGAKITVVARYKDGQGTSESKTSAATPAIANINDAPTAIALSATSVKENQAGAVIGRLTTTDPDKSDTHTYKVSDSRFEVVNGALKLKAGIALDRESTSSIALSVTSTDPGKLSKTQTFTIGVVNVDENPTAIKLSGTQIRENSKTGTTIGTFSAVDPEGTALSYKLTDSAGGLFKLSGNVLQLAKAVDYEKVQSETVTVQVTDKGKLTATKTFTITINDVLETITATPGNSTLKGSIGADKMTGSAGDNVLYGYDGNDILDGGNGNDTLYGGAGNDILIGGNTRGPDKLYGGTGADIFAFTNFSAKGGDNDTISDFRVSENDRISLAGIDANSEMSGDQGFNFIGTAKFSGKAGELRYEKKNSDTYVYGDVDGDKTADFLVHLDDAITLQKGHFLL